MKINTVPIQPQLISGTNIKTLNDNSLVGIGNVNLNSAIPQQKFTLINTTNGNPISGLTGGIAYSALIRANTFASEGFLDIVCRLNKIGTASNWTIRVYKNTSNSLTGATQIATATSPLAGANVYTQFVRCFRLLGGTIKYLTTNQVQLNDSSFTGNPEMSTTFNLAVDNYIIVGIQLFISSADVATTSFVQLIGYE